MIRLLMDIFRKSRNRLQLSKVKALFFFLLMLWYSTSGYLYFELENKPDLQLTDALWWALVTMTTVGYGDFFPETSGGRFLVGLPTMIFGIGLFGYILSEIATGLIESRSRRLKGMQPAIYQNHILIINHSTEERAIALVQELQSDSGTRNKKIVLIDETLEYISDNLNDAKVHFVKGNPTREQTLLDASAEKAGYAVIRSKDSSNPHSDDQALAVALILRKLNPDLTIIAECVDHERVGQLEAAGCNSVVCTAGLSTNLLVQELQDPGVKDVINDLISNVSGEQIYIVPITGLQVKTYADLSKQTAERFYTVIGLYRNKKQILNPQPEEPIQDSDKAILIGNKRPDQI